MKDISRGATVGLGLALSGCGQGTEQNNTPKDVTSPTATPALPPVERTIQIPASLPEQTLKALNASFIIADISRADQVGNQDESLGRLAGMGGLLSPWDLASEPIREQEGEPLVFLDYLGNIQEGLVGKYRPDQSLVELNLITSLSLGAGLSGSPVLRRGDGKCIGLVFGDDESTDTTIILSIPFKS